MSNLTSQHKEPEKRGRAIKLKPSRRMEIEIKAERNTIRIFKDRKLNQKSFFEKDHQN